MTRRPIFIGIATILALALTAGLAYGTGRMVSTRSYANQSGGRGSQGAVGVTPAGNWGGPTTGNLWGPGTAYRDQMRQWMRDWFQSWVDPSAFTGNRWNTRNRNYTSTGSVNTGTSYRGGGYQSRSGYHHDDHMGSGSWGGGYHHDDHMGSGSWGGGSHGNCCDW